MLSNHIYFVDYKIWLVKNHWIISLTLLIINTVIDIKINSSIFCDMKSFLLLQNGNAPFLTLIEEIIFPTVNQHWNDKKRNRIIINHCIFGYVSIPIINSLLHDIIY